MSEPSRLRRTMGRSGEHPIALAYFLRPDRLLAAEDGTPCPSLRNDSLPATRLSASEMSYFSLLVISDMVMAKPLEVQHTLRAALITQGFIVSFEGALRHQRVAV
ncbi:hypothetical protein AAII07_58625 [Microvirga sp. 0TCS3.31]